MGILRQLGLGAVFTAMGMVASVLVMGVEAVGSEGETKMDTVKAGSKTIVLIGASYARGWSADKLVAGYRMINKGVDGQQSYEMLSRFETDVAALKPNAVLIWGFINDIFRSDQAKLQEALGRTRKSMQAMVDSAKKAGIVPILATEVTIRGRDGWKETIGDLVGSLLRKTSYQEFVNGYVRETNRWIRDLAIREQVQLLDFEAVLADQQGVRRRDFSKPDGSHISQKGYEALTSYAEERLKAVPEY